MNKRVKNILNFCCCFLFIANVCLGQSELKNKTREAEKSDLIGIWKMTYQTVSPLFRDKSLFYADYQIFKFSEDDYVKNIALRKRIDPDKILSRLRRLPDKSIFFFSEPGLVTIKHSKADFEYIFVAIAENDFENRLRQRAPLLKKGDLIASYIDSKRNMYMQRYLSRVDFNEK